MFTGILPKATIESVFQGRNISVRADVSDSVQFIIAGENVSCAGGQSGQTGIIVSIEDARSVAEFVRLARAFRGTYISRMVNSNASGRELKVRSYSDGYFNFVVYDGLEVMADIVVTGEDAAQFAEAIDLAASLATPLLSAQPTIYAAGADVAEEEEEENVEGYIPSILGVPSILVPFLGLRSMQSKAINEPNGDSPTYSHTFVFSPFGGQMLGSECRIEFNESECEGAAEETAEVLESNISTREQTIALETLNVNGMEFVSIAGEDHRVYTKVATFNGNPIIVDGKPLIIRLIVKEPLWLYVRPSGAHTIITADGYTHYIPADFLALKWSPKSGAAVASF